jgi:hypothetical protein
MVGVLVSQFVQALRPEYRSSCGDQISYDDSCVGGGLIKRQWACQLAKRALASLRRSSCNQPKTHWMIMSACHVLVIWRVCCWKITHKVHERMLVLKANAKKDTWPTSTAMEALYSYLFWGYLFMCWSVYSTIRTIVQCHKHPLANKLFDILVSTMAPSGFGPYCHLWIQHTQSKCIGVITTPWEMTHVLGLVSFPPQHE